MTARIDASAVIHPAACVEDGATVGPGARIGAFAYVGPEVVLGAGVELRPQAHVTGDTHIGEGSVVFPFAVIGEVPQDLKFGGERTSLRIGARNRIREHATMHVGTAGGGGVTRIGDDGLFMAGSHVAHDCIVGDRVVLVNHAGLAGHVQVGDDAIVGGMAGIHQWVRIGQGAMIGALAKVSRDVLPFGLVDGPGATLEGMNLVGLRRRGASRAEIAALREAFETLARGEGAFGERAAALPEGQGALLDALRAFVLAETDRHYLTARG
ncbi:acyl-ACP--UDP-N-acetylglucosamine O-acyltransferase [Wenxinia saemankumensis]|uniref:Acyl-[acyl-carrier-protein]--UDP-N-acetylglucosamine O-acyltransferase n=1 Tax=Wenxinia saemankumensis TaxID=1447782 RepID=A0A1M6A0Y3_9RHOB|nr:acyl-ACP--UDP-N-acetylglucosamine O-acyltransferase [Wenxinia saemankumensis]SHI30066.1 acyl-[acyl-carrier-protein]--UDP-N-acetylglucosamine O-acyltransferase [Wenxinia saemankumensis]